MDFEDILGQVGSYGKYQKKLLFLFMMPTLSLTPFLCMITFFLVSSPDHWCFVPQLANYSHSVQHLSRPSTTKQGLPALDNCKYYNIDYEKAFNEYNGSLNAVTNISAIFDGPLPVETCDKWVYDRTFYDANAVTELDLVCEAAHWISIIFTLDGVGRIFGTPLFGALSDSLGRRKAFYLSVVTSIVSCASPIFFGGLYVFCLFRFLNSFILPSIFQIPYLIITEMMSPETRSKAIGYGANTWTFGFCILPLIAYLSRSWVTLSVVSALAAVPFFFYWNFLPESPRWLLSKGKYAEAHEILSAMAIENGRTVPHDLLPQLMSIGKKEKYDERDFIKYPILELVTRRGLRLKFFLITLSWIANITSYNGLTLNFQNFHGNEFNNFFLLAVVEFPSNFFFWYLMDTRLGRRWSYCLCMTIGGLSLCVPLLLPSEWPLGTQIVSLVGKFTCTAAFNIMYQHSAELFPTPLRNQGMGAAAAIGSLVNLFLPYLAAMGRVHVWIPLLIMGLICILSGVGSAFLPETLYENLPQTIEEGARFGADAPFFCLANRKGDPRRNSIYKAAY